MREEQARTADLDEDNRKGKGKIPKMRSILIKGDPWKSAGIPRC